MYGILHFVGFGSAVRKVWAYSISGNSGVGEKPSSAAARTSSLRGAVGRLIQPRQRRRRAQLERTRALVAGDGDGRFQITAGAIRIGGRTEKPRLAADAEQLDLLPAKAGSR